MYQINLVIISILNLFNNSKKINKLICLYTLVYLSIFDGIRFKTGPDWHSYMLHFYYGKYSTLYEGAYNFIVKIFRELGLEYNLFLFTISLAIYFVYFIKIYEFSEEKISLVIFYSLLAPYIGVNRQLISLSILVFSINYILKEKMIKFIIVIIIASIFHASSFIFFPSYFLSKINYSKLSKYKIYLTIIILSILGWEIFLFSFKILSTIIPFLVKYEYYFNYQIKNFSYVGLFTRITEVFIPMYFIDMKYIKNTHKKMLNICIINLLFSILVYSVFSGNFSIIVSRGTLIFRAMFLPILYGISIKSLRRNKKKKYFLIVLTIIFWNILMYKSIYLSEFKNHYLYKHIIQYN